jgi:hypothetical protein
MPERAPDPSVPTGPACAAGPARTSGSPGQQPGASLPGTGKEDRGRYPPAEPPAEPAAPARPGTATLSRTTVSPSACRLCRAGGTGAR